MDLVVLAVWGFIGAGVILFLVGLGVALHFASEGKAESYKGGIAMIVGLALVGVGVGIAVQAS